MGGTLYLGIPSINIYLAFPPVFHYENGAVNVLALDIFTSVEWTAIGKSLEELQVKR